MATLPLSGSVALHKPDPEMTDMLFHAVERVGLEWRPPLCPEPLRLGAAHAASQRPTPVPFFLEVHEEVTRSWKAPFFAINQSGSSSPLTTLDGGVVKVYTEIPGVEL